MEFLEFELSGNTAFFKIPEVNSYYYFTYGNIHKVALMGILGAILGYGGYGQWRKKERYPEFYERLEKLKIAIVPRKEGYIPKKIQVYNNSTGSASQEQGGNLIVKEQWLEHPWWKIYVKMDNNEAERVKMAILNRTCVYVPYLGSNAHPAVIGDGWMVEGEPLPMEYCGCIDSLFPAEGVTLDDDDDDIIPFKYTEFLPTGLDEHTHHHKLKKFMVTNLSVSGCSAELYQIRDKTIAFF